MNIYFDLLHKPIFSLYDVDVFYNNLQTSLSSIRSLINKCDFPVFCSQITGKSHLY